MINVMVLTKKELIGKAVKIVLNNYQEVHAELQTDGLTAINNQNKFDVLLIDVDIDDFSRLAALKSFFNNNKIIIVDFLENCFLEYNFIPSSCLGYVLQTKETSVDSLYEDILKTAEGDPLETTTETAKVCKLFAKITCAQNSIQVEDERLKALSNSEWNVIRNIGIGLTNKEISAKMYLSEGTVRNYLSNILSKLSFRDRTQLAIWANQSGVMNPAYQEKVI